MVFVVVGDERLLEGFVFEPGQQFFFEFWWPGVDEQTVDQKGVYLHRGWRKIAHAHLQALHRPKVM